MFRLFNHPQECPPNLKGINSFIANGIADRYSDRLRSGRLKFDSRQEQEIFLFSTASRPALGPTQSLIQWVPGIFPMRIKLPGREADHSAPSSAEVKNGWSCTSTPHTSQLSN
jgi:hypothetical protein